MERHQKALADLKARIEARNEKVHEHVHNNIEQIDADIIDFLSDGLLQELVDKAEPKEILVEDIQYFDYDAEGNHEVVVYHCPACGKEVLYTKDVHYCSNCGQAIKFKKK